MANGNSIEHTVMSVVSVVQDPLHGNHRRHRVHDMVFAAIVSVMCGFGSYRMFETFVALNLAWFRANGCAFGNGVTPVAAQRPSGVGPDFKLVNPGLTRHAYP